MSEEPEIKQEDVDEVLNGMKCRIYKNVEVMDNKRERVSIIEDESIFN